MTKERNTIPLTVVALLVLLCPVKSIAQNSPPIADAGLPRYTAEDPVVLDGTGSFDPDNSGILSYTWRQIAGPSVVIIDADTAMPTIAGSFQPGTGRSGPTIGGLTQTDAIQECEFELVVSDGELTSLPDTVKVIIVPDFGASQLRQENPPFDPDKPTLIYFGGGDCVTGSGSWGSTAWFEKANVISFNYGPDPSVGGLRTYYRYGDMIIVYLAAVAPDYKQPIQTSGYSTGGQPAIDVGIHLNLIYADARYAVNRVTFLDARCRNYASSVAEYLASSVDGEQCWIDNYEAGPIFYSGVLNVQVAQGDHGAPPQWYKNSLTNPDMNRFNNGLVAGVYWAVVGPGKNLQLALTPDREIYNFRWNGSTASGYLDFYDESQYPGRLPEPVTLFVWGDALEPNGIVLTCRESENAVGYQLLFGPDPYRVMDYNIVSDTPTPPTEIITTFPFEETWWTIRVRDQYGSTIYADPKRINTLALSLPVENVTTGKTYPYIQDAINEAYPGDEIVVKERVYRENISFKSKNLMLRSIDPNDPNIVATTVINGEDESSAVTFSGGEDANCVLAGFTITGGKRGIYCSSASPTITNCIIAGNENADTGAGMFLKDGSSPTLVNCTFSSNSASLMGGGMYNENSSPILINCTFAGNSATYSGGGIFCAGGSLELTNCILWDNSDPEIGGIAEAAYAAYSDIRGGWPGEGNIDVDPLFADPDNGDYHLKSQAGRWDSNSQSWVVDDVTSPCIDAGDPGTPVGLEPLPNGGIINMGAYGGTAEASKSPEK